MRKLIVAAAVAAVASLGLVGRADAQAYYPGRNGAPVTAGTYNPYPGTYGSYPTYPGTYGTYPSYPQQSSTAAHRRRDDDDRNAQSRRRDDDDRQSGYNVPSRYDQRGNYGYGTAVNGAPSRVGSHESAVQSRARTRNQSRDVRRDRDSRDR